MKRDLADLQPLLDLIADCSGRKRPGRAVADADDLLEAVRDAAYETGAQADDEPWPPDTEIRWALVAFADGRDAIFDVYRTYNEVAQAADAGAALLRATGVIFAPILWRAYA